MRFAKYQALGNDYLVLDDPGLPREREASWARLLCDRHLGVGADGLLLRGPAAGEPFGVRILNPDGSEAEKSGNGLRIFARHLFGEGCVGEAPFRVVTLGGEVECRVERAGLEIRVAMGRASFASGDVPVSGPPREMLREPIEIEGHRLLCSAVSVGNPHCVVEGAPVRENSCRRFGPRLERDARFPRRANVQLLEVLGPGRLRIEIWERGAGRTLASGSSACAAAAVAHRLGLCGPRLWVEMPGGELAIEIGPGFALTLTGPAEPVFEGELGRELQPR